MEKLLAPEVIDALEDGRISYIHTVFENIHPGDSADILEELSPENTVNILNILSSDLIVDIIKEIEVDRFFDTLQLMDDEWIAKVLDGIPPDDGADIINLLPEDRADNVLSLMKTTESRKVEELLPYPEHTAGAVMTTEVTTLPAHITVERAISILRDLAPKRETIYYIYITDENRKLLGTLSFEDLVFSKGDTTLSEIMDTDIIKRNVYDDKEEVARDIQKYDFIAMPIVDDEDLLLGIVTYDDVMDILVEEGTEDTQLMGAVEPLKSPYLFTGFWSLLRRRIIWLAILFFGEVLAAFFLKNFQGTLESMIAITFFIPLIIATSGNTGTQSASLIISGLAVGEIDIKKWFKIFTREVLTGLVMGLALGALGVFAVYLMGGNIITATIVSLALLIMIVFGTTLGSMLPLLFERIGLDPALTSTPFVMTTLDVMGVIIYLYISVFVIKVMM